MNAAQLRDVLANFGDADAIAAVLKDALPLRDPLPNKRRTERKLVVIDGQRIYVEVGFYEDGQPGEVFLRASKCGTMVRDMYDGLAIILSVALQYGVPLCAFPVRGRGNELTGHGNELLDTIFATVEELCAASPSPSPSSMSSTATP